MRIVPCIGGGYRHFSKNLKKGLDESPLRVYNAPHEGKGVFEVILKDAFFISWEVPCRVGTGRYLPVKLPCGMRTRVIGKVHRNVRFIGLEKATASFMETT